MLEGKASSRTRLAGSLLVVGLTLMKGGSAMSPSARHPGRAAFAGPAGGLKILGYGGTPVPAPGRPGAPELPRGRRCAAHSGRQACLGGLRRHGRAATPASLQYQASPLDDDLFCSAH